jgi:hypothetical protein
VRARDSGGKTSGGTSEAARDGERELERESLCVREAGEVSIAHVWCICPCLYLSVSNRHVLGVRLERAGRVMFFFCLLLIQTMNDPYQTSSPIPPRPPLPEA